MAVERLPESVNSNRLLVLAGGLFGAAGVALSAASAHSGGGNVATVALFLLAHAAVFLAAGLIGGNRILQTGCWVLMAGLLVFCGDLLTRQYLGTKLFPMAAPGGGTLMILGWLAVAASALAGRSGAR